MGTLPLLRLEGETAAAKTDSFFAIFFEPHFGQGVPFHFVLDTSSSKSLSHSLQWNS
jgi:hypothetical protein